MTPSSLSVRHLRSATAERLFRKSGTNGSNPVSSSGESANFRFLVASARGRERPSLAPSARTDPAANRDVTGAAAEALQRAVEDISPRLVAVAHKTLAPVKPSAAATNKTRVDSSRDIVPDSGTITTSAIRQTVCTQAISSAVADSPPWV